MARYDQDTIQRVQGAVDFVAIVEERTELTRSGRRRLIGRCPFHEESSPSFGIDAELERFHCFGCGLTGDAIEFVMQTDGLGLAEALEQLAERAGVAIEPVEEKPATGP